MKILEPQKDIRFPSLEKEIIGFWIDHKIFEKSLQRSKDFVFYDGPPFATGLPHFGHLVASTIKDTCCRYFALKGYKVNRQFGWDCHGVPIEMQAQTDLNLKSRKEILDYGIDKFNAHCRKKVTICMDDWKNYMERLGRWVDMDKPYRTLDLSYMDNIWGIFKKLWDKDLIYQDFQIMSYSCALSSTLSAMEASLNYQNVQDPSLTLKLPLKNQNHSMIEESLKDTSILVWTTTPWSLPSNVALAVLKDGQYLQIQVKDIQGQEQKYLILKERVSAYFEEYTVLNEYLGSDLEGLKYNPLYELEDFPEGVFSIYATDFVLKDTGTGVVHMAPSYGEDDFSLAKQRKLPLLDPLDQEGKFNHPKLSSLQGVFFKDADKIIIQELKKKGLVHDHKTFMHSYPYCYRSQTPLIYRANPSWFLRIQKIKEEFLKSNEEIHWVPEHMQQGRFKKMIESAPDWNIGRTRFWGTPLPLWKSKDGEYLCIGSAEELEKITQTKVTDLHAEHLKDIEYQGKTWVKEPYVFDCWFESGSMPTASIPGFWKDPKDMPTGDFICEGLDQTRGWFYTLNVLSTALFHKPAVKNIVVNGIVLASDGKKMSKSLKNYPDPMSTMDTLGSDSLRLAFLKSPASAGEEIRYSQESVEEATRKILLPLWNAYSFFSTYASLEDIDFPNSEEIFEKKTDPFSQKDPMDIWILSYFKKFSLDFHKNMEIYHLAPSVFATETFLENLNNWYIRRNRRRFWDGDKEAFLTLHEILLRFIQILSPLAPFLTDYLYQKLSPDDRRDESIHLTLFTKEAESSLEESKILYENEFVQRIVEQGRALRVKMGFKLRQPLSILKIGCFHSKDNEIIKSFFDTICQELNVKNIECVEPQTLSEPQLKMDFKKLGPIFGPRIQDLKKHLAVSSSWKSILEEQGMKFDDKWISLGEGLECIWNSQDADTLSHDQCVMRFSRHLSQELIEEGWMREIISQIQKTRKNLDFKVEDRIHLEIITEDTNLQKAIITFKDLLEGETLSELKVFSSLKEGTISQDKEIQNAPLEMTIDSVTLNIFMQLKLL